MVEYNTNKSLNTTENTNKQQLVNLNLTPGKSSPEVRPTDTLMVPSIPSKNIVRTFGRPDDFIELHIYNSSNTILYSDYNFRDYIIPNTNEHAPFTDHIIINPEKVLNNLGYITGKYILHINVLKNKIYNTTEYPFILKEISNSRKELRCAGGNIKNKDLDKGISGFISDLESSLYFKEFSINLGNNVIIPCVNIMLNKTPDRHEFLIKTLSPIKSQNISSNAKFKIVEEITSPFSMNVDLGNPLPLDNTISLPGPNFNVDIRQNSSIPSGFKTYDELLNYEVTSSYQHLLSKLEDDGLDLDIDYTYIKPISGAFSTERAYHFENFTHFSRATERLKNFNYKLGLIEEYDNELDNIYNITGDTSSSFAVLEDKDNISDKREKIIKNFDGYEQFLYYTSGSLFDWPKYTDTKPFLLYSVSSSEAKTWLGNEDSSFSYYGGQLLSASLFDRQNPHNLNKVIPNHVKDDLNNKLYVSFIDMIGQHFDHVWTYVKSISDIYNTHHTRGISKDLVYHQLRSLGIDTFDQFENASLIEYILGEGGSGSQAFYNVNHFYNYTSDHPSSSLGIGLAVSSSETLVTASNSSSVPKDTITKEIWKRIYHNAPYLLKTKGTERGLKALMSCYGVPSTILNVKEYGGSTTASGPLKDLDMSEYYKTFTYEKAALALRGSSGGNTANYTIRTGWSSSYGGGPTVFTYDQEKNKTVEFRVKPYRLETNQHLFSLSGSTLNLTNALYPNMDQHLILDPWNGSDISSSGDYDQYGRLQYYIGNDLVESTQYFPIYDGDFWNIFIHASQSAAAGKIDLKFEAHKSNFNKNIYSYVTSSYNVTNGAGNSNSYLYSWGSRTGAALGGNGAKWAYFGGFPANSNSEYDPVDTLKFSGSIQEIRYHFGELLSDNTLKKHALEPFMYSGNTISSSYDNLIVRLPLGSNDKESLDNLTPSKIQYISPIGGTTNMIYSDWEEVIEYHYLPTPDTVGISTTSEKVRIDEGSVDENILSPYVKGETSTLDRQPQDFEDLGIFFSPTEEINEDILYTLGSFRLDDYIGSPLPSAQTASKYEDLKTIKDLYYKKVDGRFNYWDYIKQIQYIDHTLFKLIEQFVPARANTKTGLLIEPSVLERNKIARILPIRSDAQTMITGSHQTFEFSIGTPYPNNQIYNIRSSSAKDFGQVGLDNNIVGQHDPGSYVVYHSNPHPYLTSSKGSYHKLDQGTNATIHIYDDHMNPANLNQNAENNQDCQAPITPWSGSIPDWPDYKAHESSVLLGNAVSGRKSNRYYRYPEYLLHSSSNSNQYLIPGT